MLIKVSWRAAYQEGSRAEPWTLDLPHLEPAMHRWRSSRWRDERVEARVKREL